LFQHLSIQSRPCSFSSSTQSDCSSHVHCRIFLSFIIAPVMMSAASFVI
jgi:hypothetical protein